MSYDFLNFSCCIRVVYGGAEKQGEVTRDGLCKGPKRLLQHQYV